MYTTYSSDQLRDLLKGDPDEAIVQAKFFEIVTRQNVVKSLTRQQVNALLQKVLGDEGLVQSILYAAQRAEAERMSGAEESSDDVVELLAAVSIGIMSYSEPGKINLYRSLHPKIKTIVRDYIVHKYA